MSDRLVNGCRRWNARALSALARLRVRQFILSILSKKRSQPMYPVRGPKPVLPVLVFPE
jgi:hypothetical protein